MKAEANSLLAQLPPISTDPNVYLLEEVPPDTFLAQSPVTDRLFELFLQRDDFVTFAKDFKELQATFGPADESKPFNWSQFRFETAPDFEKLYKRVLEADEEALGGVVLKEREWGLTGEEKEALKEKKRVEKEENSENLRDVQRRNKRVMSDWETAVGAGAVEGENEGGEKGDRKEGLFTVSDVDDIPEDTPMILKDSRGRKEVLVNVEGEDKIPLVDQSGRAWSGCILDTDSTQKVTPGNRVQSKRVLVCIGNLRGAGGFGMGKGKDNSEALNAAFR